MGCTLGTGCTVAGHKAFAGGLCHLLTLGGSTGLTDLDGQQHLHTGLTDGIHHLVEHVKMCIRDRRPLIGMDKTEIVETARHINTFETSILPYEDCLSLIHIYRYGILRTRKPAA